MTQAGTVTSGHLLDGRVIHDQFADGHRTGIEPVLLAATIPAQPGQRVLEAGCGSGAGLLCLAARVAPLHGLGVEIDPDTADLARRNLRANGLADFAVAVADIAAFRSEPIFDHAFANPPWHEAAGTASPDRARERARRAGPETFADWIRGLAQVLRHRGTLSLITAAAAMPDCLAALAATGCGGPTILPLWPRAGSAAKLVMLQSRRGGHAPARLLPGLVLHSPDGGFTAPADGVLRRGDPISFD